MLTQTDALALLVENADFGVIGLDARLLIAVWNPWMAARTGVAPEAAQGRPLQKVFPHLPDTSLQVIESVLQTGQTRVLSPSLHEPWGLFPADLRQYVRLQPVRDGRKEIRGLLVIIQDMTGPLEFEEEVERLNHEMTRLLNEIKESNAKLLATTRRLEEVNADMEAFVYSVSHDLRAPLRAIQGFAGVLMESRADQLDSLTLDYLGRMDSAARRMDTLIQDLLSYSRVGRAEMNLMPVYLDSLIAEVLQQMEMDIGVRRAIVDVQGPLPVVMGHYPVLVQVLTNLIGNAVKFVPADVVPRVLIRGEAATEGEAPYPRVRLWIEDNGIGIAPEYQERIFHVFERLHGADQYPGTGVGLAIVRKGIARMGGCAGVESVPGQGSRFWIELSAADRTSEERNRLPPEPPMPASRWG
ncbi:MAG TPA: ATP-binding protein [Syntrophobacteraceae bacterium]|nr:ATP-binding protein [Syntrophobacteraceae bacterium]